MRMELKQIEDSSIVVGEDNDMDISTGTFALIRVLLQAFNILIKEIRQLKPGFKTAHGYMIVSREGAPMSAVYRSKKIAKDVLEGSTTVGVKLVAVYWEH